MYDWQKKWNGTLQSLLPGSHKPHSHPKQNTEAEIKMIIKIYREKGFLEPLLPRQELIENGYTRSFGGMKNFIRKYFGQGKKEKLSVPNSAVADYLAVMF